MRYGFFPDGGQSFPLWRYRRLIDRSQFEAGAFDGDISVINWPQNDYWPGCSILDVPEAERAGRLEAARQPSLSLPYRLQTQAPRPDGKAGYPG